MILSSLENPWFTSLFPVRDNWIVFLRKNGKIIAYLRIPQFVREILCRTVVFVYIVYTYLKYVSWFSCYSKLISK